MSTQPLSFAQLVGQFQVVNVGTLLWLRKSKTNKAGTAPIHLRIFIGSDRIEHSTGLRVSPEEWDAEAGRIKGKGKAVQQQNEQLQLLKAHIPELVNLMKATGRKVTIRTLRQQLMAPTVGKSPCFIEICQQASASRDKQNPAARDTARTALNALSRWHGKVPHTDLPRPLPLDEFTPKLALEFYHWLTQVSKMQVASANHLISHMVGLFRYVAELGEVEIGDNPFRALRKKKAETAAAKLRLTLVQFATLRDASLPKKEGLARDIYLAQYYLHGSRVGAVLKLRWQDVGADVVRFKAEKGGPLKQVRLSEPLRQVLARYRPADTKPAGLVFAVLPADFFALDADAQYSARKQGTGFVNRYLERVAGLLDIAGDLRSHTARHTLAAHASQLGGLGVAQVMLGHATEAMTAHYAGPQHNPQLERVEQALYSTGANTPPPAPDTTPLIPLWGSAA